jgi:hypothetical protein
MDCEPGAFLAISPVSSEDKKNQDVLLADMTNTASGYPVDKCRDACSQFYLDNAERLNYGGSNIQLRPLTIQ